MAQVGTSAKVAELFKMAGEALSSLGELTLQLHPPSESSITAYDQQLSPDQHPMLYNIQCTILYQGYSTHLRHLWMRKRRCKWTDVEVDEMMAAVKTFCTSLNRISSTIKSRTVTQIRTQMKKRAYEGAGLAVPDTVGAECQTETPEVGAGEEGVVEQEHPAYIEGQGVTLSALNSPDSTDTDPDLDDLNNSDPTNGATSSSAGPPATKRPRIEPEHNEEEESE